MSWTSKRSHLIPSMTAKSQGILWWLQVSVAKQCRREWIENKERIRITKEFLLEKYSNTLTLKINYVRYALCRYSDERRKVSRKKLSFLCIWQISSFFQNIKMRRSCRKVNAGKGKPRKHGKCQKWHKMLGKKRRKRFFRTSAPMIYYLMNA